MSTLHKAETDFLFANIKQEFGVVKPNNVYPLGSGGLNQKSVAVVNTTNKKTGNILDFPR